MALESARYDAAVAAFLSQAVGLRVTRWYATGPIWAIEAPVGRVVAQFSWHGEAAPTLREAIDVVLAQRD